MSDIGFEKQPRQPYLSEQTFRKTLQWFENDYRILKEKLIEHGANPNHKATLLRSWANRTWSTFQMRFTTGEKLDDLALYLTEVVMAYERYIEALHDVPDDEYFPPFIFDDMIDTYVDYINMLSAAILLHREELIPRIHAFIEGTDYDEADAIIEILLSFYLPNRSELDDWYWKPYSPLVNAIDQQAPSDRSKGMEKYVKGWYKSMKGVAHFWGKHEKIKPDYSPYDGYWAMCAGAFTYLYDIDDSKYRDEMVYPKDMVDYARSKPRKAKAPSMDN